MNKNVTLGAGIAVALIALPASAQQPVERVEITGSSIKRMEGETALPVQVISREEIEKTGAVNVEQFLQTLGVSLQGNNNTSAATAAGASSGSVSGVSLRGLGSQRTLVLIDGKRVAGGGTITDSTTVDVNMIPAAAIERIDVLKDGASAIYGSDAIAGVINFILRKDYKGGEVSAFAQKSEHAGGNIVRAYGMVGWGDLSKDRFSANVFVNYQKESSLVGGQRDFSKSGINVDANNDTTSGNTFPANINDFTGSGATRNPSAPGCPAPYAINDPLFPPNRCRFDPSPLVTLVPETEVKSIFGNLRFKLTPQHEAYGQLSYTNKETRTIIQPVPISDQFALPNNHPLFNAPLRPGSPYTYGGASTIVTQNTPQDLYYPGAYATAQFGGTPDLLVRYRAAVNGNRDFTDISDQGRFVAGVKGTVFEKWDYDAAYLHTETRLTEKVNGGYPSLSAILPLLNSGQVNFWGPNTPATEQQLRATGFTGDAYKTRTKIDSLLGKVTTDLTQLPAGPLGFAAGAEGRKEAFKIDPSAAITTGDISGYGGNFLPVDVDRNVTALFAEFNIPLLKTLEAGLAARYDNYQGTGSRTSPKANIRFQPVREVLFRASAGQGFRAPSLTELYQPQTIGVTAPGLNDPLRCSVTGSSNDCGTQFPITLGGNTALKSETSKNYTIGMLLEPTNNISIGFDYFQIDLKSPIIFGVTPAAILADLNKYGGLVTRGACSAGDIALFGAAPCVGPITNINQLNINLGEQAVKGFDVNLRYRLPLAEYGTFTFGLDGTKLTTYNIQNPDGSWTDIRGIVSPIVNGAGGVIPTWRHYAFVDYRWGPWNATLAQSYQSGYKDMPGTFDDTDPTSPTYTGITHPKVSRYEIYNLYGSWTGTKDNNVKIMAGIRNLFNKNPPYTNAGGQNWFQAGYDPGYVDPRGRAFFASLTWKFM